jgi:diacylglycerol O-acyltransferase / wax synthase
MFRHMPQRLALNDGIPLGAEDRAILDLECQTIAGHTCKVVRVGAALDPAQLSERVAERIALTPALTRRLGGTTENPAWVADERFDIHEHVKAAPVEGPVDHDGMLALVARLFEQRLDRSRPLWQMDTVALSDGDSALIWRIHHALADGTTSIRYSRALLWDQEPKTSMTPAQAAAAHAADEARRRAHLALFLHREYARSRLRSPFDGKVGTRREIGFAAVSMSKLHTAAKTLVDGATINDAMLSVVAGALWRWMRACHGHLGSIRARVPVSLHHEGEQAGNHDSFFSLALPLNESDPVARLRTIHRETDRRKERHDAEYRADLLEELSGVSPRLEKFVTRIESSPRSFALNISNVRGPHEPVSLLGAPVRRLHSIAEIGERHALRVSAISFADQLGFGFCADPNLVDQLQLLADGVEVEAGELLLAAGIS